jgi:hypothetical protein
MICKAIADGTADAARMMVYDDDLRTTLKVMLVTGLEAVGPEGFYTTAIRKALVGCC